MAHVRYAVKSQREVPDAVDEAGEQPVWRRRGVDVRHPDQQFSQDRCDLPSGQVGPETEVRASGTEADVRVGRAADVKAGRIVEDGLVPVGRWPAVRIWVTASPGSALRNSGSAPDRMILVFLSTIA